MQAADAAGWTPLMLAVRGGKLDAVRSLLKAGANAEAANAQVLLRPGHPAALASTCSRHAWGGAAGQRLEASLHQCPSLARALPCTHPVPMFALYPSRAALRCTWRPSTVRPRSAGCWRSSAHRCVGGVITCRWVHPYWVGLTTGIQAVFPGSATLSFRPHAAAGAGGA